MKLPIFSSIEVTDFSKEGLVEAFIKCQLGDYPLYLYLESKDKKETLSILETVYEIITDMNINIRFPYPFYVVSPALDHYEGLLIVNNTSQLPRHFVKRIKRLKNREMTLLNKTKLMLDKLKNHDIEMELDKIKARSYQNKELFNITKENNFYQKVLESIRMLNG